MSSNGIYGDTTGELHTAWLNKVAATKREDSASAPPEPSTRPETLPHEALQPLFNDVLLYPSKSQVFEMVQCARECSNQVRMMAVCLGFEGSKQVYCQKTRGQMATIRAIEISLI